MSALEELKASRESGKRKLAEVEDIENVYDVVDVDEYSEIVSNRQNDDWIVDDDGLYVEDGREIFDEEMGDEKDGHRSSKSEKSGKKGNPSKIRRKANASSRQSRQNGINTESIRKLAILDCDRSCFYLCLYSAFSGNKTAEL